MGASSIALSIELVQLKIEDRHPQIITEKSEKPNFNGIFVNRYIFCKIKENPTH